MIIPGRLGVQHENPARTKADFHISITQEIMALRTQLFSIGTDTAKTKIKHTCEETSVINSVARTFFLLQTFCLKWHRVRE
jgi:hypothetical protein